MTDGWVWEAGRKRYRAPEAPFNSMKMVVSSLFTPLCHEPLCARGRLALSDLCVG